jgi:NADPH2:quinone reductase
MTRFRAFRIHGGTPYHAAVEYLAEETLGNDDVLIRTQYSSVNYKDALAGTGRGRILRRFPLTGGIDCAGTVETSNDPRFQPGDPVIVTGYGLSQTHDGGYAEWLRVPAEWVVPLPKNLSLAEAMTLGTAGFTAALALHRMTQNGQTPDHGPLLVTGASGGVGTIAINMFASAGYEVTAASGKPHLQPFLESLGAKQVLPRDALHAPARPLETGEWGGIVDTVGGNVLAGLLPRIRPWGSVASIGLAAGHELHTTLMPFLLRGISLLGINSADCPHALRTHLWERLASDLKPPDLGRLKSKTIGLGDLPDAFDRMLNGNVYGRIVIKTSEH